MRRLWERAKVVAGSFVFYAVAGTAAVNVLVAELEPFGHIGPVAVAVKVGAAAVSVVTVAVGIIRKVTQVVDEHVGLLPVDGLYTEDRLPLDWSPE